jgi:hypothetical protein
MASPNFEHLLGKPAGIHKRPEALPAGDYPAVIKSHAVGDNNKNKTPYVRLAIGLTGWPDSVDESDRFTGEGDDRRPIDLSKKQFNIDFYLTDDAFWRLDEFISSCGIEPGGRSYLEILPELHGTAILAAIIQRLGDDNNTYNRVDKVVGAG